MAQIRNLYMADLFGHEKDPPRLEHDAHLEPSWEHRGTRAVMPEELEGAKAYVLKEAKTKLWLGKLETCFETTYEEWTLSPRKLLVRVAVFAAQKHLSEYTDPSEQRRPGRKKTPADIKRIRKGYVRGVMWIFAQRSATVRRERAANKPESIS